jgi:hypothetical protein
MLEVSTKKFHFHRHAGILDVDTSSMTLELWHRHQLWTALSLRHCCKIQHAHLLTYLLTTNIHVFLQCKKSILNGDNIIYSQKSRHFIMYQKFGKWFSQFFYKESL